MTDHSRAITASVVGAVVGGLAGYILFTERGRLFRQRLEAALDDFSREINNLEGTMQKAALTANEGWRVVTASVGQRGSQPPDSNVH